MEPPTNAILSPQQQKTQQKLQIVRSRDDKIKVCGLLPVQQLVQMPAGKLQPVQQQQVHQQPQVQQVQHQPQVQQQPKVQQQPQVLQQQPGLNSEQSPIPRLV